MHQMRVRIITSPSFNGDKVIGAILFEKTMDGEADGKPVPQLMWERGVVPFLKVDKGLEDQADGVKLMKPIPGLDALLDRAAALGRVRHQDAFGDRTCLAERNRGHRRPAVRGRRPDRARRG